jgi:hypothetical protein
MSPRPDRRAERLPQILAATRTVFARSSFAEVRMEGIAQAASLSKAAIYLTVQAQGERLALSQPPWRPPWSRCSGG